MAGPVLVCCSAYTLFVDLERATSLYPNAPKIAVKGASSLVQAFAIFGLHPGKLDAMREAQLKLHSDFTVHTAGEQRDSTRFHQNKTGYYDTHWGDLGGGCSGWCAVKMADRMGFDQIILCGCPLDKGGYANGMFSKHFQTQKIIDLYRKHVLNDIWLHEKVISMSGWTRDILGDHFISDKEPQAISGTH